MRASRPKPRHRKQRGVALAFVSLFMVVIAGFAAVGIDIAFLAHTANEVQTIADAAARGGAVNLGANGGAPNTGITRAHDIAAQNAMNGALATVAANVPVDEGVFDPTSKQFKCCTTNSTCCSTAQNMGSFSCTGAPAGGCATRSAVLAEPFTSVNSIFAGIFDYVSAGHFASTAGSGPNGTTVVEKVAVATPAGPSAGCQVPAGCTAGNWACYCSHGVAPCLPIVAPECQYTPGCTSNNCLPSLRVSNDNTDTAAWTLFNENGNGVPKSAEWMSQGPSCTQSPAKILGQDFDPTAGATVGINGGVNGTPLYTQVQCLFQHQYGCGYDSVNNRITAGPGTVFSIPIISGCQGQLVQGGQLAGFATIQITNVTVPGGGNAPNSIDVQTKAVTNAPGGGGAECFGTNCVVQLAR